MSQNKAQFWNRKTYCLITGASQGIGRQIAISFASNVAAESTFLLLARNAEKLNETKTMMEAVAPKVNVLTHSFDFKEPIGTELRKIISLSLATFRQEADEFELAVVVHNAGSVGDLSELTHEMTNMEKLTGYFTLNVFSVAILNAEFLRCFDVKKRECDLDHPEVDKEQKCEICVINITSICAVKPCASMGYYCMGKSTREMLLGVVAEENKQYTVLNYSPGPVLTDMTGQIIDNIRNDEMKDLFVKMTTDSTILTTQQTIAKLVQVLGDRNFVSGGRVDYFDP